MRACRRLNVCYLTKRRGNQKVKRTRWRLLGALLACVSVIAGVVCTAEAKPVDPFRDVPSGHWAYEVVHALEAAGAFSGFPDGTFDGTRVLTRYECSVATRRLLEEAEQQLLDGDYLLWPAHRRGLSPYTRLAKEYLPELKMLGARDLGSFLGCVEGAWRRIRSLNRQQYVELYQQHLAAILERHTQPADVQAREAGRKQAERDWAGARPGFYRAITSARSAAVHPYLGLPIRTKWRRPVPSPRCGAGRLRRPAIEPDLWVAGYNMETLRRVKKHGLPNGAVTSEER